MKLEHHLNLIEQEFIAIGCYQRQIVIDRLPNFAVLLDCAFDEVDDDASRRLLRRLDEAVFQAYMLFSAVHVETFITDLYDPDWTEGLCVNFLEVRRNPNGRCVEEAERASILAPDDPDYSSVCSQRGTIEKVLLAEGRYSWRRQCFYLTHAQRKGITLTDAVCHRLNRLALSLPPFYERLNGWRPVNALFVDYVEKLLRRHSVAEDNRALIDPSLVQTLYRINSERPLREGRRKLKYWADIPLDRLTCLLNHPSELGSWTMLRTNKCYDLLNALSRTIMSPELRRQWVEEAQRVLCGVRLSQHSFSSDGSEEEDLLEKLFVSK